MGQIGILLTQHTSNSIFTHHFSAAANLGYQQILGSQDVICEPNCSLSLWMVL